MSETALHSRVVFFERPSFSWGIRFQGMNSLATIRHPSGVKIFLPGGWKGGVAPEGRRFIARGFNPWFV